MRNPLQKLRAGRDERREQALAARLRAVLTALGQTPAPQANLDQLSLALQPLLRSDRPDVLWLVLATVSGVLPSASDVLAAARSCDFDGPVASLDAILADTHPDGSRLKGEWADVAIVTGRVLVDLHHTSQTELATGIQRVARQATRRWHDRHELTLVGWSDRFTHLRALSAERSAVALYGKADAPSKDAAGGGLNTDSGRAQVLVPWQCMYLLPELMTERTRALRLQALVSFSGSRTGAIGFDCVPLTSAETIGEGMGGGFSVNLTAIARMDRLVTISDAAAVEYRGWRAMLAGAGVLGPDIAAVSLAVEAGSADAEARAAVRRDLAVGALPLILVVGSHEPRKNHLAVLHAAELLWREGHRFSITFVGGNAWNSQRFTNRLAELQGVGRPVQTVSALSESMLWAAYELAAFTVFPSLNEGFGLPVAESLAKGTPVITSGFGSMREIACSGGALLIDPRSDTDLTDGIRTLLTDPERLSTLRAEAELVRGKSWDTYAAEVWQYLVEDEDRPAARAAALENGIR